MRNIITGFRPVGEAIEIQESDNNAEAILYREFRRRIAEIVIIYTEHQPSAYPFLVGEERDKRLLANLKRLRER